MSTDSVAAAQKRYSLKHRAQLNARAAIYRAKHRSKINQAAALYKAKHREEIKLYKIKNKEKIRRREYGRIERIRKENMTWLLDHLGTKRISCVQCGYDKDFAAIDLHHTDPSIKRNSWDGLDYNLRHRNFSEWFKRSHGVFLCSNCHRELHATLRRIADESNTSQS